jgi:hypothetical protein
MRPCAARSAIGAAGKRCIAQSGRAQFHRAITAPWGLLGALALIITIECAIQRRWLEFSDPVSLSWIYSVRSATNQAPTAELLCLGDSLVKHGLIPAVMEPITRCRTVNLSAARSPTLMTYSLLRRALDAGARPSAIIIDAKPAVQLGGPEFNARAWQSVVTPSDALDLLFVTRKPSFVASTLMGRLLPSVRSRLEIQASLLAALEGQTNRLQVMNHVLWRNWTINGGANVISADRSFEGELTRENERELYAGMFYVDPANAKAIERLLRLAGDRGIPVFWVLFPISDKLQSLRDQSGAELQYEQFVRNVQSRHPRVLTVLDGRRAGYTNALLADATHLNSRGAIALSRSVARALDRSLTVRPANADCAWINLGLPDDPTTEFAFLLEDLEQSQRILKATSAELVLSP